ncbi:MAG: L-lactate dehydrogenase [bacterium]|nr:L-lactate dehydrogenase [bacterium]
MERENWKPRKVVVVGAGAVGSTFVYALARNGIADEIVLIDRDDKLLRGQVLDLAHGLPFFPTVVIRAGDYPDCADAHVVVIAAGAKQKPGESRLDLLRRNVGIMEGIVDRIIRTGSQAVMVVVSNPVDILTHVAARRADRERGRVIGSGTVLDSARFRYLLSRHCGVDVHNVHAYILGEHGDSEFAAWSMTHLAGMAIDDYCPTCMKCGDWRRDRADIEKAVRDSAYHVIDYKGSTFYAIGLALALIVGAILRNQHSVLTVSTMLDGEYGVKDVCLSVPCIVNQRGVARIVEGRLREEELASLSNSAAVLRKEIG